jgi:predicted metalloprotease
MGLGGGAVLLVLSLLFGHNFFNDVAPGGEGAGAGVGVEADAPPATETPEEHQRALFVSFVLDDVQSTWAKIFTSSGEQYRDAKLVLFRNATESGCGVAQSAMGPFYCPVDQKVYIDLGFYDELTNRFGASGDFAQAYVLAHELGHHVQHLLGTDARVRQLEESRPDQANNLSVRLELQADCYAGVWANSTDQRKLLNEGDVTEALTAASAVGDDRIQQEETGSVHPESFTHGTAAQRASWFKRGYTSGRPDACDTFAGAI